jgi:hypothetical protein
MVTSNYRVPRRWAVVSIVSPLPVVALAIAFGWSWWLSLGLLTGMIAVVAEFAGIYCGAMAALLSTAGTALIIGERTDQRHPRNGLELLAMAVLLLAAVVFGSDHQVS